MIFFWKNGLKKVSPIILSHPRRKKERYTFIPREKIWKWIDGDVENRAWYFAYRLVSKTLSAEEWQNSLVRAFLVRYGEREDVRRNLKANYSTESYSGERSLYLNENREKLLRIKADEEDWERQTMA